MSRKAQLFRLAPGGIQRIDGCLADDGGAIAIGNDDPGAGGQEAVLLQIADTETGGDRPEVAVAIIEIFRPFEIAAQVGDGDLDLDERDSAIREDRTSVVEGKGVSVRVDLGGRGCIKKKK